jgi:hypothetical protein
MVIGFVIGLVGSSYLDIIDEWALNYLPTDLHDVVVPATVPVKNGTNGNGHKDD